MFNSNGTRRCHLPSRVARTQWSCWIDKTVRTWI